MIQQIVAVQHGNHKSVRIPRKIKKAAKHIFLGTNKMIRPRNKWEWKAFYVYRGTWIVPKKYLEQLDVNKWLQYAKINGIVLCDYI